MKTLFILNDSPYGTERDYNALRLAMTLLKQEGEAVKIFLMADAASCAKAGQHLPQGYYSLERMLKAIRIKGGEIGVCGMFVFHQCSVLFAKCHWALSARVPSTCPRGPRLVHRPAPSSSSERCLAPQPSHRQAALLLL